ncbi:MAG: hypothetical protein ACTHKH_13805, partial [Trinickia sp.]
LPRARLMQRACRRAASALPRRRPEQRVRPVTAPAEQCAAQYDEHFELPQRGNERRAFVSAIGRKYDGLSNRCNNQAGINFLRKSVRLNEARFEFHNPEM